MKTLNYVKILLLCVFTIGLASCGDDVYYTMQNSDDKLCGKTWIEEYQTENKDGVEVLCSHQLKFAKADNSGQEIWEYYRGGEYNPQIQISAESGTKRSIFRQKNKTKRSKKRLRTTLIKSEQKVNETSVPALYFRKNTFRMAF